MKGKNGFEYLLSALEAANTLQDLQHQLDEFRIIYCTKRPHGALATKTPQSSYEATIKATPKDAKDKEHYRVRHDSVDQFGKLSLRRAGKMHHLGVGIEHNFNRVFVVVDQYRVSVVVKKIGEVLSKHEIQPARTYWTNYLVDEKTKR